MPRSAGTRRAMRVRNSSGPMPGRADLGLHSLQQARRAPVPGRYKRSQVVASCCSAGCPPSTYQCAVGTGCALARASTAGEQQIETTVGFHVAEIGAVLAKIAKKLAIVRQCTPCPMTAMPRRRTGMVSGGWPPAVRRRSQSPPCEKRRVDACSRDTPTAVRQTARAD